jgi:hypothetical protein
MNTVPQEKGKSATDRTQQIDTQTTMGGQQGVGRAQSELDIGKFVLQPVNVAGYAAADLVVTQTPPANRSGPNSGSNERLQLFGAAQQTHGIVEPGLAVFVCLLGYTAGNAWDDQVCYLSEIG